MQMLRYVRSVKNKHEAPILKRNGGTNESGKILLDEIVSHRRPLEEINEAFDDMKAVQVIRTVIDY